MHALLLLRCDSQPRDLNAPLQTHDLPGVGQAFGIFNCGLHVQVSCVNAWARNTPCFTDLRLENYVHYPYEFQFSSSASFQGFNAEVNVQPGLLHRLTGILNILVRMPLLWMLLGIRAVIDSVRVFSIMRGYKLDEWKGKTLRAGFICERCSWVV